MAKLHGNNTWYTNIYFWRRWSGKTQQAVIDAYEAYQRGETVISNIWLDFYHIRFVKTKDLVPILYEIAEYCNEVSMPSNAPLNMLKDYGMKKKKMKNIKKFFILWDEIWKNLNARNWQKNFKDDEILIDMLTEPRKYWLTIIWIAQSWKFIDAQFRNITEDWFLFSRTWGWIFERMNCTHLWVHDWEFDYEKPIIIDKKSQFVFFFKMLKFFRTLYWTGEIVWAWVYKNVPHTYTPWVIYKKSVPKSPVSILPLIKPVPDIEEAPEGPVLLPKPSIRKKRRSKNNLDDSGISI